MSTEKLFHEAKRWFTTAEDDLDTAGILIKSAKYAHSCFHAQQAGEKALKSIWYLIDADPWGHSIKMLIDGLEAENKEYYREMKNLERIGSVLDRFYIPTRYPNGLPDMTPDMAFSMEDAMTCIAHAREILDKVKSILKI
ncbi:protein containing HEPN domain [sediment metagenome]|uniref:Protein containing HEPN domain n=1 Tax=sediment metagenome TaxID=749907 RepID=D9PJA2_9ZZZZ